MRFMRIIILVLIIWNIMLQIDIVNIKRQIETNEPDESIILEPIDLKEIGYGK